MSTEENSRTPQLRFPGFRGEWKEKKLGDVTNNEDNKRCPIARMNRQDGVYPYYGANGIQDYVDGYIFDGDYLLVGEDGSVLSKENTPVIHWATGKFWVNNHAHVLSQKGNVNLKFVSYNLTTIKIQGLVTGIPPKLNQENLNNISLPIPSKPEEQQKIADCLSELDALITAQGQKVEALKEKKKGLLQQMFPQNGETTPRLRFSGFTGEWKEKTLSDCIEERNELFPENEEYPLMAFIAGKGVSPKGEKYDRSALVKDAANKKYKRTVYGDFIYSSNNLESGSIGLNTYGCACISPVYSIFKSKNGTNPIFIGMLLTQKSFISEMIKYRQGVVYGQWKIPEKEFLGMKIFVPSKLAEQQEIAECLSAIDDQISTEIARLDALKDHKKGLMQKLFPEPSK